MLILVNTFALSSCGEHVHEFDERNIINNATYIATGLTEGSRCSICNEVIKAQEKIIIPESVKFMDSNVFRGCENLTIYCEARYIHDSWAENLNSTFCKVIRNYKNNK